jgi:DnaJ-class molecular chaperone
MSKSVALNSVKPFYRQLPQLTHGTLTTIQDTIITCTLCRGQRLVAVKSQWQNRITYKTCMQCKGSGTMSNNQEKYEVRK